MNRNEFYDNLNKYRANSLTHYGTLGQKWGVRKWQNYDGTFNEAGKERYFGSTGKNKEDKINDKAEKMTQRMTNHPILYNSKDIPEEDIRKYFKAFYSTPILLRSTYNVNNKYREMYGEDPNKKLDFNMRTMEQNAYAQNARTAIPLGSMEGSKVKSKYQNPDGSLTKKGEKLYNSKNPLTRMNAEKLINQNLLNEYSFNKKKEEHANHMDALEKLTKDDPAYNGNLYDYEKNYSYMHPESKDEKLGGLFNKTPEEKEFKEAKRLAQKLNFDNGTKVIKELKNTEYGKKHIKPLYDEFEENMNKLSDKANKIIKDNPVDEIEAGIANAIDTSGGNANIGYIINCIRKQHYAKAADGFINVDSLPLLKSEEDLWTEAQKYKKDFGDKIEKEFKNLYPKAKTDLSYFIALTDYENDKLDKIYDMNDEDYRRYQLYHRINYGLVPEINKKSIRKDIIEPAEKLYPKVEKIINNTKVGDLSYDWSDIGKALVELGLDKKNADELTNADWKKVYEICSQ